MITYDQALSYFLSPSQKNTSTSTYNLNNITEAMHRLWNPQNDYQIIHIAGTNGKWSVSQMCFSILKQAGKQVGIFTSPHLIDLRERRQTNDGLISKVDFIKLTNRIIWLEMNLSFFEKCCVMAFLYFKKQECDIAVIEVGVGGLLDSTNIVQPTITTITSIGHDHMHILGNTLEEIAAQKAGIITPWIPIVINQHNKIIEEIAASKRAPVIFTNKHYTTNLHGSHQTSNAALAYEITTYLWVDKLTILEWLQHVSHPGRLHYLRPNLLIDGAHNQASRISLKQYLDTIRNNWDNMVYCIGLKKGKEALIQDMLLPMFGETHEYIIVDIDHSLTLPADTIQKQMSSATQALTPGQIHHLVQENPQTLYVVFWSLYMIWSLYEL